MVAKAKRAAAERQQIVIDFHYGDTWADAGTQSKPAASAGQTLKDRRTDATNHTANVFTALKSARVTVSWGQVCRHCDAYHLIWNLGTDGLGVFYWEPDAYPG